MFKGIKNTIDYDCSKAEATVPINTIICKWTDIFDTPIVQGQSIKIIATLTSSYDGYCFYEIDSSDTLLKAIEEGSTPDFEEPLPEFEYTTTEATVAGIAIVNTNHLEAILFSFNLAIGFTVDECIEDPITALKYIKKLQNWSELGVDYDFGKDPVPEALIKPSGDGSYLSSTLDEVKGLEIARQILNENEAYTDDLAESLCREFFLISYQDKDGYECVKYLLDGTTPTETISYSDIQGKIGELEEPTAKNVFCEPVVNYAYDYALGVYTKQLRINNITKDVYSADYSTGFSGSDGQGAWNTCRELYNIVKQIEPMPQRLTDTKWIQTYDTALWYLENLLIWMKSYRITLSVDYDKGRLWDVGTRITLTLPHQTSGEGVPTTVELFTKSKRRGIVTVSLVIFFLKAKYWQDTYSLTTIRQYIDMYNDVYIVQDQDEDLI